MVKALTTNHALSWLAPGPMWGAFGDLADPEHRRRFAQPAILRFANDAFMDELMGALALYPEKISEWQARWETWEEPMTSPPTAARIPRNEPLSNHAVQLVRAPAMLGRKSRANQLTVSRAPEPDAEHPLKLYQPVQNRFYLVTASLVCQQAGLPDRHVNPGKQEQVGFVLRRRIPPETGASEDPLSWDEYAYVQTAHGPRWQKLENGRSGTLQKGEERMPMFSLGYVDSSNNGRRLFAGLIPVGRREAYLGAALAEDSVPEQLNGNGASIDDADTGPDTRELLFALQVTGPWRELVHHVQAQRINFYRSKNSVPPAGSPGPNDADRLSLAQDIKAARANAQTGSWYMLLDFARFIRVHLPRIWQTLRGNTVQPALNSAEQGLITHLQNVVLHPAFRTKLANDLLVDSRYDGASIKENLKSAILPFVLDTDKALEKRLEGIETPFEYSGPLSLDWPNFLFPLAEPGLDPHASADRGRGPFPFVVNGRDLSNSEIGDNETLTPIEEFLDDLGARVRAALPDRAGSPQPDIQFPSEMPLAGADAWFTIRCVYERPNCGVLDPPLLSAPTEAFQMASFFDPDAPARQIRIPMPINISPAALRRYNKSATLVVSDMLCGQLKRIRKLSLGDLVLSVLPWPFHKDLPKPGPGGSCADSLGMLCSLSIPIVTLCALILLLIIVALFDLFFHWIPLLFLCFPIPKFFRSRP